MTAPLAPVYFHGDQPIRGRQFLKAAYDAADTFMFGIGYSVRQIESPAGTRLLVSCRLKLLRRPVKVKFLGFSYTDDPDPSLIWPEKEYYSFQAQVDLRRAISQDIEIQAAQWFARYTYEIRQKLGLPQIRR